jgi:mannan endo-1,4-beta-mannosidase
MGCVGSEQCVRDAHAPAEIDYLTAHIWPQNWSWVDPEDLPGTYATAEANTRAYIASHIDMAQALGKPLVIEEFGFPRDGVALEPGAPTTLRDRFYGLIQNAVLESARAGGPLAGSNFWAWGGAGRAQHSDRHMRPDDTSYVGDPPHEPQGWYSVFDVDESTTTQISAHARALAETV